MDAKPPPTDQAGLTDGRRRLVSCIGGLGVAGIVGAIVAPLTDAVVLSVGTPDPADGLVTGVRGTTEGS